MATIEIRRTEDLHTVLELDKQCLEGVAWYQPADAFWLAYHKNKPIAYAAMAPSQQWANVGYLCRAGVLPEYRGLGIQKRLIRVRVAYARKLGYLAVVTDTTDNPASANSLISCGFKLYQPFFPWAFKHTCYWRLILK